MKALENAGKFKIVLQDVLAAVDRGRAASKTG